MPNQPEKECDEIEADRQQAKTLGVDASTELFTAFLAAAHTAKAVGMVDRACAKAVECARCGDPSDGKRLCKVCRVEAAAPKLLAALKAMAINHLAHCDILNFPCGLCNCGKERAKKAIAEAEEGQ